jgi:hypothetical protein
MSLEFWNTVGAVGTFLVITVTAIAALVQLRHLRQGNQLNALLAVLRMPYEPVLHEAFEFVNSELAHRLEDPDFMHLLNERPANRFVHKELWVLDYYERLGAYLKWGLIDSGVYLDSSSPGQFWEALKPVIKYLRDRRGPWVYENFEYLAYLAERWDERYPAGNYPHGAKRLTLD